VEHVDPGGFGRAHLVGEAAEVGGEDGGRELDAAHDGILTPVAATLYTCPRRRISNYARPHCHRLHLRPSSLSD